MFARFKNKREKNILKAYISGKLMDLTEVEDQVFSTKMMGDGVATLASDSIVHAPCDGKIRLVVPTNHAIALENKDDMQILIHIGLDSTQFESGSFEVCVSVGETVKQGDVLIRIKEETFASIPQLVVPMVILENPKSMQLLHPIAFDNVTSKESVILSYE